MQSRYPRFSILPIIWLSDPFPKFPMASRIIRFRVCEQVKFSDHHDAPRNRRPRPGSAAVPAKICQCNHDKDHDYTKTLTDGIMITLTNFGRHGCQCQCVAADSRAGPPSIMIMMSRFNPFRRVLGPANASTRASTRRRRPRAIGRPTAAARAGQAAGPGRPEPGPEPCRGRFQVRVSMPVAGPTAL